MDNNNNYNIDLEIKYGHQTLIDIPEIIRNTKEKWSNRTLTQVNKSVVRLGIIEGEFHWHKHENDDEFFFVVEGRLFIDLEPQTDGSAGRTIELKQSQGVTISKGVMHKPHTPERTVILMVENKDIQPTGD